MRGSSGEPLCEGFRGGGEDGGAEGGVGSRKRFAVQGSGESLRSAADSLCFGGTGWWCAQGFENLRFRRAVQVFAEGKGCEVRVVRGRVHGVSGARDRGLVCGDPGNG